MCVCMYGMDIYVMGNWREIIDDKDVYGWLEMESMIVKDVGRQVWACYNGRHFVLVFQVKI